MKQITTAAEVLLSSDVLDGNSLRTGAYVLNSVCRRFHFNTAAAGAFFLDMDEDNRYPGVYHARVDCWQEQFGYNSVYDLVFDIFTSMSRDCFPFTYQGKSYIFWVWKGDYLNLGAGAELGIYYGTDAHRLADQALSMYMEMEVFYPRSNQVPFIHHGNTTWWITSFNSNPEYMYRDAKDLRAEFRVTFTDPEMFQAFQQQWHGRGGWTCDQTAPIAHLSF